MATEQGPICVPFPKPRSLKIQTPFGDLNSVVDISKGPPTDCTLIHGLMLQLSPALVSMECFLRLLKFVSVIKDLASTPPLDAVPKIIGAASDLGECILSIGKIPKMIIDILKLIIAYLKCIIEAVRSILAFQAGINLGDAEDNPAVSLSFDCAQNNAAASTAQLREALEAIQPLLDVFKSLLSVAGTTLPGPAQDATKIIPDIVDTLKLVLSGGGATVGVPGTQDTIQTLDDLKNTLEQLQDSLDPLS
ncbi:MAG: hypothetical protein KME16_00350 [Scytolyngbya sp. HA4215-MV1]|jgi:hypothetical protein|nr:hypothetical protein [Scytolyngbya sp. HA4215-MV1]